MISSTANDIINHYATKRGYPTLPQINSMDRIEFTKGLKLWATEYISALPDAGLHYNLTDKLIHPQTGQIAGSEWGWKMEQVEKTVEFRNTTEGKKYVLQHLVPEAVRNEETDANDMLNIASIKVSAITSSARSNKKQTQINIKRINHIRALEKSISKGGSLRAMYEATFNAHKDSIENLMTNEDAAKAAMQSKRKKKIFSLLLSWLVMPLYVILRTLDMFFDAGIILAKMGYKGAQLGPKVGSTHPFLGRFSIPLVVAAFISFTSAIAKYNAGVEKYVDHGIVVSGIIMIPLYMIEFIILKQFLDIPFMWLTKKYGTIAKWASCRFDPTTAEEFQLGEVTQTFEYHELLGHMIRERENLIKGLTEAIESNVSSSPFDTYCKDKKFSLKTLEKEERDAFN